jgi:hypothetical protein
MLYWTQMVELKVAAAYFRRYRDRLGKWTTTLGTVKAVASCGGIAGWAVWKEYAFAWGSIIAASQLADALKDVFPFAKKHKAACEHAITLDSLFIDAQLEWEGIFSGKYTDDEIARRRHKLMKLQHDATSSHFPDGLAVQERLFALAQHEAKEYFKTTYDVQ